MEYVRSPISNGNPLEQALIRRWWYLEHNAQGRIVWEYFLEGRYLDAIWFPDVPGNMLEEPGLESQSRFSLKNAQVVLCEAKLKLTPELIGQALVYMRLAIRAEAKVKETIIFAENGEKSMREVAEELGLTVMLNSERQH